MNEKQYDLIVIGSGAAGMIAAITARRAGKNVLLIEQLQNLGAKLKATGGGRCNLSNTLDNETFMHSFGRNGRFMSDALNMFEHNSLRNFLKEIGVETHIPDGFRIFPTTHDSSSIISALENELKKSGVEILYSTKVQKIIFENGCVLEVSANSDRYRTSNVIIATGGLGYPMLGSSGDGYDFAKDAGHKITKLYPAMLPLYTKETWVGKCKADTIAKAQMKINLKKAKNLKATGDLIFTSNGIRGPVVLDFAREITPFLEQMDEVPILVNLTKGMNEEEIFSHIRSNPKETIVQSLSTIMPNSVATQICLQCGADPDMRFGKLDGSIRNLLVKTLAQTPLTIVGHDGFKKAMITRGGVSLKEINPKTMQSKLVKGLYFCGEVVDLDGPCGGYNLQWSFSSGYLAGHLLS